MYFKLGSEFMPPLREGSLLYMPSAVQPGMSVAEAQKALQVQDKILMTFPEIDRVFGKAGRAGTSTDPAPFTMMETTILLKPESQWREKPRWYSAWAPEWLKRVLRTAWRDRITEEELIAELDAALRLPGISNAWTMPIKGRLDMLSTGIRTPIGIKVSGADLGVDPEGRLWRSSPPSRRCPRRAAFSPSGSPAATSSTSCSTATSWRATACPSTTPT